MRCKVMKLKGFVSNTGALYLMAFVVSEKYKIYNALVFLIDTGASHSFISYEDAEIIGLDFDELRKGSPALGLGGVMETYVLDDVQLLFRSEQEGFLHVKNMDELGVLSKPSHKALLTIPSVLGQDFLGDYVLEYDAKRKTVYLIVAKAADRNIPDTQVKQTLNLDAENPDQRDFLDKYRFIVYPETFVNRLCSYLHARLREFFIKKPTSEKEIQNEIEKLLAARNYRYEREGVMFKFGTKRYIPDFTFPGKSTVLEAKLCKSPERMKAISDEILADIAAYNTRFKHQVFVIYDLGVIRRELEFKREIEKLHSNAVIMIIKD